MSGTTVSRPVVVVSSDRLEQQMSGTTVSRPVMVVSSDRLEQLLTGRPVDQDHATNILTLNFLEKMGLFLVRLGNDRQEIILISLLAASHPELVGSRIQLMAATQASSE
nr:hypothetical protein BaRGS_005096 [Batillaria attramentaria]